jgi:bifunctional DNA-binding transcriptional regulator/antitoxin component of YhaV-PrlF toxin-antitoxin module
MEKIITFDKQGRLYLPEEMRRYLQVKTLVARIMGKTIILEPIEEDPIEALGKLGKEKLKGKSIKKLKKQAREEIENEAIKKLRR